MLINFQGMDFDINSGQAYCNGIATGLTFEFVSQALPQPGENPDTSRTITIISPWAYATAATADKIRQAMQIHTQRPLNVEFGDPNPSFPTNVQQRQISAQEGSKKARVNAGLIATGL